MSDQAASAKQNPSMSEKRAGKKPLRDPAPEHQHQHQHQHARGPAFPLINPNENLEKQFSKTSEMMMEFFRQEDAEEAEKLARILLSWGATPVMYRAYAHMVSRTPIKRHS